MMMLRLPSSPDFLAMAHFNCSTSTWSQPLIICVIHQSRMIAISKVAASGVVKELDGRDVPYTSESSITSYGIRPCLPI